MDPGFRERKIDLFLPFPAAGSPGDSGPARGSIGLTGRLGGQFLGLLRSGIIGLAGIIGPFSLHDPGWSPNRVPIPGIILGTGISSTSCGLGRAFRHPLHGRFVIGRGIGCPTHGRFRAIPLPGCRFPRRIFFRGFLFGCGLLCFGGPPIGFACPVGH